MSIICSLQNMSLHFGHKAIFDQAKITINKNDKIGLLGLNGQGKSTLFKILMGQIEPDSSNPKFIFDKAKDFDVFLVPQELNTKDYKELTIRQFYLSFYPNLLNTQKELFKVQNQLVEDYSNEKLLNKQQKLMDDFEHQDGWTIENSYLSYLNYFELDNLDRTLENLSGGEKRKIAISIGLSSPSNFILWDEPTNHLDVETIKKLEDELLSLDKTIMIISHDRYLLNNVSNRIIHIEKGNIESFDGHYLAYLEYLEEKEKERLKNLDKLENKHRRELAWMRQGIKARGTRSKKRVEGYHQMKDDIQKLKSKSKKVVDLQLSHTGRKSKQLINIQDASFSFSDKDIFKNLNLKLFKGDKIALIGPNGAGKTTLLNLLNHQLFFNKGNYKPIDDLKLVTFDQKRESLDESKTPFELIGDGQDFVHLPNGKQKHVMSYLEQFLFHRDQVNSPISTLSGGEKARLQMAQFMKQSADVWIFDEPTNDLDIETIEFLEKELAEYEAAVIIVGHDRAFLDNVCKQTWVVHNNNVEVFQGGYSQTEPYLEALELEKQLLSKEETQSEQIELKKDSPVEETPVTKMNYNEKKRWDVIEDEIMTQEEKVETLEAELAKFDFGNQTQEIMKSYQEMSQKTQNEKSLLEKLYLEWEDLSQKTP